MNHRKCDDFRRKSLKCHLSNASHPTVASSSSHILWFPHVRNDAAAVAAAVLCIKNIKIEEKKNVELAMDIFGKSFIDGRHDEYPIHDDVNVILFECSIKGNLKYGTIIMYVEKCKLIHTELIVLRI